MSAQPTDIGVDFHGERVSLSCDLAGAHFHIWTDRSLKPLDATVFKNPPRGTKHGSAEDFRTRRLGAEKGQGRVVFEALMAAAPALLPQALEREAAAARAEDDAMRARIAEHHVREAAPELLTAAPTALDALTDERADDVFKANAADLLRSAISKATATGGSS